MTITLFCSGYPNNQSPNSGIFTHRSALALSCDVDIIVVHFQAFDFKRKLMVEEKWDGIKIFRLAIPQIPHFNKMLLLKINIFIYHILGFFLLPKEVKKADVFHSTGLIPTGMITQKWASKLKIRHISQSIGDDVNFYLKSFNKSIYWKKILQNIDAFQFNSSALLKYFETLHDTNSPKFVNYRGVDVELFEQKKYSTDEKIRFLFLGGIQTYNPQKEELLNTKGGHLLLKAWKKFENYSSDIELYFGGPGVELDILNKWRESLNFPKKVKLFGRVDPMKIPELIRNSNVVIIPSINEGLPNLANEASSCGVPVLGSDCGGIPERILHKKTGFIVPKNNVVELINGLIWFMKNKKQIPSLGANARELVESELTWKKYVLIIVEKINLLH